MSGVGLSRFWDSYGCLGGAPTGNPDQSLHEIRFVIGTAGRRLPVDWGDIAFTKVRRPQAQRANCGWPGAGSLSAVTRRRGR
ncbi:hypothetical protein TI01_2286 [Lysobacter sp. A03]|nr:hypothetical protein TI01_2286 [Lysobacter sp. A03]